MGLVVIILGLKMFLFLRKKFQLKFGKEFIGQVIELEEVIYLYMG